jgi:hypothetical protein
VRIVSCAAVCIYAHLNPPVSAHQRNHQRIQSLRAASAALDGQIRDTLTLLTTTRAELIATAASDLPTTGAPISYSELLSYARRISKFTLPPNYREPLPTALSTPADPLSAAKTPESKTQTNGTATPIATPIVSNGTLPTTTNGTPAEPDPHSKDLPTEISAHLTLQHDFVPWPTEERIRRGALADIQTLLNSGIDPETFDPDKVAELHEATRQREEEEEARRKEEEEVRRAEMEARRLSAGMGHRESVVEEKKVFTGLDILDDDDDDD